jgi:RNase P/RNase MRP subunit p30
MPIDLNVKIPSSDLCHSFIEMAEQLGITGLAVPFKLENPLIKTKSGITLFRRTNLTGNSVPALRKQLRQVRQQSIIVAVPFKSIEIVNWAAGDSRVDLLTFDHLSTENMLRESTAQLAADSETVLEIPVFSLLKTQGLDRSRIVKPIREACEIAYNEGMNVVLSSGSTAPIEMRSPVALQHIGLFFGMDTQYWKKSVFEIPNQIIERTQKKMHPDHIASGIELVRGDVQE